MPFGQLVIGSPGAGKTTYCDGLHQFLTAVGRPIAIVNLDPANGRALPYPCAINMAELITVKDVMIEEGLGPNGAMLYCMEYLEEHFDWLESRLNALGTDAYVAFDLPGQVELSTNHGSLQRIMNRLQKLDWRFVAVHLLDATHITDASRYISLLLLSLRTMLMLELPHVNVLSKVDLLGNATTVEEGGGLAFNLDFYTEVQDLSYLVEHVNAAMGPRQSEKYAELNQRICELVEDFGLVQFETLAVEDKQSMMRLQRVLDKATGYVYTSRNDRSQGSRNGTAASASALFTVADHGKPIGWGNAFDVQERFVDHQDEWEAFEQNQRRELQQKWQQHNGGDNTQAIVEKEQFQLPNVKEKNV